VTRDTLDAVTTEYATLFKLPAEDLFQLSKENSSQVLASEIHAQVDLARRLSFKTDWCFTMTVIG
jgi:hypothetical protein